MKKTQTSVADNAHMVALQQRKYMHYNSFNRKDAIMRYIQISIACLIAVLVCTGLYNLSK